MSTAPSQTDSLSSTYRRLASAQKNSAGVALYSRWVNRPLGRLFAVLAFRLGMSPNQVTAVSAAFTFGGIILLAGMPPSWTLAVSVTALLVLGYALDSADGQVARLRGGGRPSGEWLDHVIDAAKAVTLHLAVLIHWYLYLDLPSASLLIPLAFAVVSSTWFFAEILTQMLERLHPSADAPPRARPRFQPLLALPADHGVLSLTFILLAVSDAWALVYSALAFINSAMLLRQLHSWYKRVNTLARTPTGPPGWDASPSGREATTQ